MSHFFSKPRACDSMIRKLHTKNNSFCLFYFYTIEASFLDHFSLKNRRFTVVVIDELHLWKFLTFAESHTSFVIWKVLSLAFSYFSLSFMTFLTLKILRKAKNCISLYFEISVVMRVWSIFLICNHTFEVATSVQSKLFFVTLLTFYGL